MDTTHLSDTRIRPLEPRHAIGMPLTALLALIGTVEGADSLLLVQHVGMLPSMLLLLDEYSGHGAHALAAA